MLTKNNTVNSVNDQIQQQTFNYLDGFKIIVLSKTETKSIDLCKWLSNSNREISGFYRRSMNKTFIAFFPYWYRREMKASDCQIYDAMVINADIEEEFSSMKDEIIHKYTSVPIKLVVSKQDTANRGRNELGLKFYQMDPEIKSEQVIEKLLLLDRELYQSLKMTFSKYDDDKSGYIEINEIGNLAKTFGEDTRSEKFKSAVMALDINHDNRISFSEFIKYYKFGRGNNSSLVEVYNLYNNVNEFLYRTLDFINLRKEIRSYDSQDTSKKNKGNMSLAMSSIESFITKTRINFKFSIGSQHSVENAKSYLSRFSDDLSHSNSDWFAIGVFLKPNGISSIEASKYLNEFKDNIIKHLEENQVLGLSKFISDFIIFEVIPYDYSVNLMIRLKHDIKSLIFFSLENLLLIKNFLEHFEFDFNLTSNKSLGNLITSCNSTISDLLKNYEIIIRSSSIRSKVKVFFENVFDQSYMSLFQFLFVPTQMKIEFTGPIEELVDDTTKEFLGQELSFVEPALSFLKKNLNEKLYHSLSRIEFTCNIFEVFANLQIYSGCL